VWTADLQFQVCLACGSCSFRANWKRLRRAGQPIRYGYLDAPYPLSAFQTIFAAQPGSAEMPSAAYPFTERLLDSLHERRVQIAEVTLHTGVSSLEVEAEEIEYHPLYPEPFDVPAGAAQAVNGLRQKTGNRRRRRSSALESAWDGGECCPCQVLPGFPARQRRSRGGRPPHPARPGHH
jgi:hypothetical protein